MIECLKKLHPNTSLSKLDIEKYESVVIIKKSQLFWFIVSKVPHHELSSIIVFIGIYVHKYI